MNPTRRLMTAVLLTMMMLSGCLGAGDGATEGRDDGGLIPTAQGSTTTVVNGNYLPDGSCSTNGRYGGRCFVGLGK